MESEPVHVRAASDADTRAVRACVLEAFEPYIVRIGKPPAPMLLDFAAQIAAGHVWVAERGSQVEGVLVQYETPDGSYIDTVATSARCRGTGVGRALLEFAEREAVRRGFESVFLCTNSKMTENQLLYSRAGYAEFDRHALAGYDRIFYRKALA